MDYNEERVSLPAGSIVGIVRTQGRRIECEDFKPDNNAKGVSLPAGSIVGIVRTQGHRPQFKGETVVYFWEYKVNYNTMEDVTCQLYRFCQLYQVCQFRRPVNFPTLLAQEYTRVSCAPRVHPPPVVLRALSA